MGQLQKGKKLRLVNCLNSEQSAVEQTSLILIKCAKTFISRPILKLRHENVSLGVYYLQRCVQWSDKALNLGPQANEIYVHN